MATRRWLKIGGGVAATITTILGLFGLLSVLYGFEIVDLTGDFICEGTYENPCISEFEIRNPNSYNVDIYSKDQVKLDFSPDIKDWALFVPDGRCSATGTCACDLENGEKIGFEDWRCVDFTNKTKSRKDKVYNFRFERYSTTKFRLVGFKKNQEDTIKWGFETNNKTLDPTWIGIEKEKEGGGIIVPQFNQYRVGKELESNIYDIDVEGLKVILSPKEGVIVDKNIETIRKGATKSKIDSRNSENVTKKDGLFEITLDNTKKYYEIGEENITIEGIADSWCEYNCVAYFNITPASSNLAPGIEIYTKPDNKKYRLYVFKTHPKRNRGEWKIVNDEDNFEFEEGKTYAFKLLLFKGEKESVKWGVKAVGEELDPTFYGDDDMLLVWGQSTNNYPNYNDGSTSNSWGSTRDVHTDVVADTSQLHIVQHPNKEEKLLVWIDTSEDIHAKFWSGSVWSDYSELEIDGYISDRFTIAVATETNTGDYLVAYSRADSSVDDYVAYQTYIDGIGWSGVQTINLDLGAQTENMVLVSDPTSDNIMLLASESGDSLDAWIWDGDSFENHVQLTIDLEDGSSGDPTTYVPEVPFATAWINSTGEAIVIWGEEGDEIYSRRWNGASWDSAKLQKSGVLTTDLQYIVLRSSMWEDKIRGGFFDNDNDIWGFELNSTLDIVNLTEFSITGYTNYPYKAIDVVMPEEGKFVYAWSDTAYGYYMVDSYNYASDAQTFTTNDIRTVHGDFTGDMAMFSCEDDTGDLSVFMYNISASSESYTDNLETSMEETFSHQIQVNVYFGEAPAFTPNITECGNLTQADTTYYIQNNLQSSAGCLRVMANNITVEGQGYNIDFGSGEEYYVSAIRMMSNYSTIRNFTVNTTDPYCAGCQMGLYIDGTSNGKVYNNTIEYVRLNAVDAWAVGIDVEGDNHRISNAYVTNVDQYDLITAWSNNVEFVNITINNSGAFEVLSPYASTNIIFRNIIEYNNTGGHDIFFWDDQNATNISIIDSVLDAEIYIDDATSNLTVINTTYPSEQIDWGYLERQWYATPKVTESDSSPIESATVKINDTSSQVYSDTTNAQGFAPQTILTQYINSSAVTIHKTPHIFSANKTGYNQNITNVTMDQSKTVTLILESADTCIYASENWNIDCSNNCVISSNVNIDLGSNISMTGTGTFTINNGIKISGWTYRYADRTCYVKAFGSGGFFQ